MQSRDERWRKLYTYKNTPCHKQTLHKHRHTPEQIHTQTNRQTRHISTRIFKALHASFSNIVALLQSGFLK